MVNVCVDVRLLKILIFVLVMNMVVSSGLSCKYELEWGRGVRQEDRIAEEGGRNDAADTCKVDNSAGAGGDESFDVVCHEAGLDVPDGRASHFVGWKKECSAKVVSVVDDRDLFRVVCNKEEAKGLGEPSHFYVEVRVAVHGAVEAGDVMVSGLVHRVERGEEGFPGGVEDRGACFYFYSYKRTDGFDDEGAAAMTATSGRMALTTRVRWQ